MGPRGFLPAWLRRGVEAGLAGAVICIASLLGSTLRAGPEMVALPSGLAGSLMLAPAVLALGVITVGYPIAFAATRSDALFGSIAAYLIAADLVTVVAGARVALHAVGREVPVGALAVLLGMLPAVAGLVVGQIGTPLGFGRRAAALAVASSAVVSAGVLLVVSRLS